MLAHTMFAYDKLMHSCDVKTMIYHFLNMVVTSKLYISFFEHGWETVFYHTYTVKVYYNWLYATFDDIESCTFTCMNIVIQ